VTWGIWCRPTTGAVCLCIGICGRGPQGGGEAKEGRIVQKRGRDWTILTTPMRAVDIIRKKRNGAKLGPTEIAFFVDGVTTGAFADYQASALLMAILLRGMDDEETAWLTESMVDVGAPPGLLRSARTEGRQAQHRRRGR